MTVILLENRGSVTRSWALSSFGELFELRFESKFCTRFQKVGVPFKKPGNLSKSWYDLQIPEFETFFKSHNSQSFSRALKLLYRLNPDSQASLPWVSFLNSWQRRRCPESSNRIFPNQHWATNTNKLLHLTTLHSFLWIATILNVQAIPLLNYSFTHTF